MYLFLHNYFLNYYYYLLLLFPKLSWPMQVSSSSSCRVASTDIPDPLTPLFPIIHRLWQVFRATPRILTSLRYACSSWSSCFCLVICGGPLEYITYELVLASPAVSCMSGSSSLDSFRDGRKVAMQVYEISITKVETMERSISKYTKRCWEYLTPKQMWHNTVYQRS